MSQRMINSPGEKWTDYSDHVAMTHLYAVFVESEVIGVNGRHAHTCILQYGTTEDYQVSYEDNYVCKEPIIIITTQRYNNEHTSQNTILCNIKEWPKPLHYCNTSSSSGSYVSTDATRLLTLTCFSSFLMASRMWE